MSAATALLRLDVRRDRSMLALWVLGAAVLTAVVVTSAASAYPSAAARARFVASANADPAELALRGPVFGDSVAAITTWTMSSSMALVVAVASVLLVVRHTRLEEQTGRAELVASTAVRPLAPLVAAVSLTVAVDVVAGVAVATTAMLFGLPVAGSLVLGGALAATGTAFAGVGAASAQMLQTATGARTCAVGVVGVAFLAVAVADARGSDLWWLSPFGWTRHAAAFADDRAGLLVLGPVAAAVLVVIAVALRRRRDLGAGLAPIRPGPPRAAASLRGPLALSWRTQRAPVLGTAFTLALLAFLVGTVSAQLDPDALSFLADGALPPVARFRTVLVYVLAQIVSVLGIVGILRLRSEELAGTAEVVLATRVRRRRWWTAHVATATAAVVLALAATGLGIAVGSGEPAAGLETLTYLPACLCLLGVTVLAVGWTPRAADPIAWAAFGVVLVLDLLTELGVVSAGIGRLSPFAAAIGDLQQGTWPLWPMVLSTVLAALATAVGAGHLERRDLG